MKIFISSLIRGMEAERAAAKRAVESLGHAPVMAEEFGAIPMTPQIACLQGVRDADVVVLILGSRYGTTQPSGVSATHEEFRAARGNKPVLMFITNEALETDQQNFVEAEGGWVDGLFQERFGSPEDLQAKITRQLHRYITSTAAGPVDPASLAQRARQLATPSSSRHGASRPLLGLAVATGPRQALLRPAQLESDELVAELQQHALFGRKPIFERSRGVDARWEGDSLEIYQGDPYRAPSDCRLQVHATGDVYVQLPVDRSTAGRSMGLPVIIEEDVRGSLEAALEFAVWWLHRVDPTHRATHLSLAACLEGSSVFGWRTRIEHEASPNSGTITRLGHDESPQAVQLAPATLTRQALAMDQATVAEDLLVLIRRQWRPR